MVRHDHSGHQQLICSELLKHFTKTVTTKLHI